MKVYAPGGECLRYGRAFTPLQQQNLLYVANPALEIPALSQVPSANYQVQSRVAVSLLFKGF